MMVLVALSRFRGSGWVTGSYFCPLAIAWLVCEDLQFLVICRVQLVLSPLVSYHLRVAVVSVKS